MAYVYSFGTEMFQHVLLHKQDLTNSLTNQLAVLVWYLKKEGGEKKARWQRGDNDKAF